MSGGHISAVVSRVLDALRIKGAEPKEAKEGQWTAYCPVHELDGGKHRPSLSVGVGDDGRVLLRCHAGCDVGRVVGAIGLRMADLMPTADGGMSNRGGARGTRAYPDLETAAQAYRLGRPAHIWQYHDAGGEVVGAVCRWDRPGGKEIRPLTRRADGWHLGAMDAPRPLFRLPVLLARPAEPVYVVEGERCADAAAACGLLATTSAGGAQAAKATDWTPTAGRRVVILPDNDEAGEGYALRVAHLARQSGAASVRILRLADHVPDLPVGGDIADVVHDPTWCGVPLGESATAEDLGRLIRQWATEASEWTAEAASATLWEPFPIETLPAPIRGLVEAGAQALQCDASLIAFPALAIAAGCIGLTRVLRLKRAWRVPAILWCVTIGESGSGKTPAFRLAERALHRRERQALREYRAAVEEWIRTRGPLTGDEEGQSSRPTLRRVVVTDITVERLATLLQENPRGLLLARDELSGWLAGFDRYSSGKGKGGASVDAAFWTSTHSGQAVRIDRKTNNEHVYVPRAAVSICGTIQPRILERCLGEEHRENGLLARLLLAMPPRRHKTWTEDDIDAAIIDRFGRVLDGLLALEMITPTDDDGEPRPVVLRLSDEARSLWIDYYNRHAREHSAMEGDLASAWGKLEEYAARLALVLHLVRCADGDSAADPYIVDAESMRAGITLAEWCGHEIRRVYAALKESAEERDRRQLVEWIASHGGAVTVRQITHGMRRFSGRSDDAEMALDALARGGFGRWEDNPRHPKGGRPTRVFRIASPKPQKTRGF